VRETVPSALDGERVDRVVAMLTGLPRSDVAGLVDSGAVRVDGVPATSRSRRVVTGEVVEVDIPEAQPPVAPDPDPTVDLDLVYVDDSVLVVDKPAGVVVHPGAGTPAATLVNGLLARFPEIAGVGDPERPGIVHRLDKGTSGLMVVARTADAYDSLVAQLSSRVVQRQYLALAWGHLEAPQGLVDAPVGRATRARTRMAVSAEGREARTLYTVLERFGTYRATAGEVRLQVTLLECRLETGRTHQIRVHLSAIGHPVVGDARYGGVRQSLPCPRPFLHAHRLSFEHPATAEQLSFDSPVPADLQDVLDRLS